MAILGKGKFMQESSEVHKMVFPIKIVWLALLGSLFIYGILLYSMGKTGFQDLKNIEAMKEVLYPLSFIPFIFSIIFFKKLNTIIRKTNMDTAPFAKHMNANDKRTLSYYSSYFIIHVILWALNEAGAIIGFLMTFVSGNFKYYLLSGSIAFFINLVLLKPNYLKFIQGKNLEQI